MFSCAVFVCEMSKKMHIVLAFFLSVFSAILVVLNFNQNHDLALEKNGRNSAMFTNDYPRYNRSANSVQISDNLIYKEIKPYRSQNISSKTLSFTPPLYKASDLPVVSYVGQKQGNNSFQNYNSYLQNARNNNVYERFTGGSFVSQYGTGSENFKINNNINAGFISYRSGVHTQANVEKQSSGVIAGGVGDLGGNLFASASSTPSFAKSDMFSSNIGVDPGGDPGDPGEMIPVPDGMFLLILMSLIYTIVIFVRKK